MSSVPQGFVKGKLFGAKIPRPERNGKTLSQIIFYPLLFVSSKLDSVAASGHDAGLRTNSLDWRDSTISGCSLVNGCKIMFFCELLPMVVDYVEISISYGAGGGCGY